MAIACAWVRYGKAMDLVLSCHGLVHDGLGALQVMTYALHEFTESGLIPGIDNAWWHAATEDLAECTIAQFISLLVVPTVWLAHWQDRRNAVGRPVSG